jgi:hypothetical protein
LQNPNHIVTDVPPTFLISSDLLNISKANKPGGDADAVDDTESAAGAGAANSHAAGNSGAEIKTAAVQTSGSAEATVVAPALPQSQASQQPQGQPQRVDDEPSGFTLLSLLPLLVPVLLYYLLSRSQDFRKFGSAAFVCSAVMIVIRTFKIHIGQPTRKFANRSTASLASGRTLVRFPVDLNKLIRLVLPALICSAVFHRTAAALLLLL